ncbi:hypothetical protein RND81_07G131000 [Saponaria officinalis]|uniref:Retrovirus-related Pol polyprotein from transposon TNT 1-94-like beta-barrel domain-containing protein n=1 Tax=Saponaria officinalis TaxID=3572 RepID=A0AAW1JSE2_SAPOF
MPDLSQFWKDLRSMDEIPDCSCGVLSTCSCNILKKILEHENKYMLIYFHMGLDKKYENLRGQILAMEPLPTINQAFSKVHQAELQRSLSNADVESNLDGLAMAAHKFSAAAKLSTSFKPHQNVWKRESKKPKVDKCSYYCDFCNKSGHTIDFCFKLRDLTNRQGSSCGFRGNAHPGKQIAAHVEEVQECAEDTPCELPGASSSGSGQPRVDPAFVQAVIQKMYKVFNSAPSATPDSTSQRFGGMIFASTAKSIFLPHRDITWIVDYGASDHMTFDCTNFVSHSPLPHPVAVTLPDGQHKSVQFVGIVQLIDKITLQHVLYLPYFKHKLLSLGRLLEDSALIANFTLSGCSIQYPSTKKVLLSGWRSAAGVFHFTNSAVPSATTADCLSFNANKCNDVSLFHARLGHVSVTALKHVVSPFSCGPLGSVQSEILDRSLIFPHDC